MLNKRQIGSAYEKRAGEWLLKQGYQILQYNFHCPSGEIDIVAKDGEYLVFCEVKYRRTSGSGRPLEAVTYRKQKILSDCAMHYLEIHHLSEIPCRFDVVGILGERISLVKDAFSCGG